MSNKLDAAADKAAIGKTAASKTTLSKTAGSSLNSNKTQGSSGAPSLDGSKLTPGKATALRTIAALFLGFCTSAALYVFCALRYYDDSLYSASGNSIAVAMKNAIGTLTRTRPMVIVLAIIIFLAASVAIFFYMRNRKKVNNFIFRFRYPIAIIILALCVIFELNGSSICKWAYDLPFGDKSALLLGRPRACRTDEYALFTGMTFAQYLDPQGSWPYFGEVLRGTTTDMFMVYGQPVLDPSILVRPFQIGYLVLGLSHGLSFYWFARAIALFMTSFEVARIITKDNRLLSFAFACMMVFAPVIAWWFSINTFVEMLVFFNIIIICLNAYPKIEGVAKRRLLIVATAYSCVCYVFCLYPAWQVPLGFVLLAMIIPIIYENGSAYRRNLKADWYVVAICFVAAIACVGAIAYHSYDAIMATLNTDYPGSRTELGGSGLLLLFRYPVSLFFSFVPAAASSGLVSGLPDNLTTFFDLCPLGIVLAIVNIVREKRVNPTTLALLMVIVFLGLYCAVGFPEILAKVTLMGKTMTTRAIVIFSFANLVLLFHEVARFKSIEPAQAGAHTALKQISGKNVAAVCVCVVACLAVCALCKSYETAFVGKAKFVVMFVLLLCVWLAAAFGKQRAFVSACVIIAILTGAFVNPVARGISEVEDNPVISEIREVSQENPGDKWVAAVSWKVNIMLFAGAPTINTTNIYPNEELWAVLDPTGERKSDWNRYAHIHCKIVSEDVGSSFEKTQVDALQVRFTLSDLRKLDVKFMAVEQGEMQLTDEEMQQLELISTVDTYSIYRIKD